MELHALCTRVAGIEQGPEHAPERPGDIRRSVIDPARAERELGWRPEVTLEDGLRLTWDWVRATAAV